MYVKFESELALLEPEDRADYLTTFGLTDEDCGLKVRSFCYLSIFTVTVLHTTTASWILEFCIYHTDYSHLSSLSLCALFQALVKAAYSSLGLQTYFTSGPTETKAWTIKKGMTAPQVLLSQLLTTSPYV